MVSRLLLVLASIVLTSCASSNCSPGSEFEPSLCASDLPPISQITIRHNAVRSAQVSEAAHCDGFAVSDVQLRMYFSAALQVDSNDAHHTLDWSPCHASGDIRFADGSVGVWSVSQTRVGSLSIAGGDAITLYCPRCTFPPFR